MDLASLSCQRCRRYKRKCSRELPICDRCRCLDAECAYPRRKPREKRIMVTPRDDQSTALINAYHSGPIEGRSSLLTSLAMETQLASQTTELTLLDVYFSQFIPSSIIHQQGRTRRLYLHGQLCTGVLHAMFALASLFLGRAQTPSKWRRLDDMASISHIARHHGQDWANNASHIVSLQLHAPSVDTVRTLSNLTTYWFGVGQRERSQAGANMVIQATRDLQMQSLHLPKPQSRDLRWSCLWADMLCRCFVLDDSFANTNQDIDISDITQSSEGLVSGGIGSIDSILSVSLETQPTPGQEALLKALGLWRDARSFIRSLRFIYIIAPEADLAVRWGALFTLDSKVTSCYSSFPPSLRYLHGGCLHDSGEAPELLLSLQAVYHQCRALLHLAMFMFLRRKGSASPDYVHLCAQISVSHLNHFADVATSFMSLAPSSASANPPFIAYCAFLTASIHLACLNICQGPTGILPEASPSVLALLRERVLSSLLLLQHLQCYWASCKELLNRLQRLCLSVGISTADVEMHGFILQEAPTSFPSDTIHDDTPSAPLLLDRKELDAIMSRHLTQILQMIDLSHPAYISFQDLQSPPIIACDPSSPGHSANIPQQPCYEIQPKPTRTSPFATLQPMPHENIATASKHTHRRKPRTWIPARPVAPSLGILEG